MSLGGPTTTTQYNQQQNQNQQQSGLNASQNTITPNLPDWLNNYYQGMPGQQQNLITQAQQQLNRPLYGPQQQANYQQQLNSQLAQANQNIQSSLARSGALNSSRAAQAQTGLALGGAQQMGNYLAQTPLLNAQFNQSALGQLGNILTNAMNWKPPVIGQTSTGLNATSGQSSGQSDTSGTQTQQTSGGLLQSLLGGLLNAGMGIATGGLSTLAQGAMGGALSDNPVSSGGGGLLANVMQNANYGNQNWGSLPPQGPLYPWGVGGAGLPPSIGG